MPNLKIELTEEERNMLVWALGALKGLMQKMKDEGTPASVVLSAAIPAVDRLQTKLQTLGKESVDVQ